MGGSWKQLAKVSCGLPGRERKASANGTPTRSPAAPPARLNGVPVVLPEEPLGNSHLALMKAHDPPCLLVVASSISTKCVASNPNPGPGST